MDRYSYGFGRDQDGEVYVCTNRQFRPEGDTGIVYRIVSADEGTYEPAEGEETTPEQEETTPAETTPEETTTVEEDGN
jgi:hypothetical protein